MQYNKLVKVEKEFTYSANIQYDIDSDRQLLRFIPNETNTGLFKDFFIDIVRDKSEIHSRILYGSYGTGKSHFLTVLSMLLEKKYIDSDAYKVFIGRIKERDASLAKDIDSFSGNNNRKPYLVVPVISDFDDFDRCIYFSLKKKLEEEGKFVSFNTFFEQALALIKQWEAQEASENSFKVACKNAKVSTSRLKTMLEQFDKTAEPYFQAVFSEMAFGVRFVYEVSNLTGAISEANEAVKDDYSGIVFIFDEFGRYLEDNIETIRIKSVQDLAELCDHGEFDNHVILVSHKEISLYTQKFGENVVAEWKKVEGRYRATPINDKQDQCLSLVRNVMVKDESVWERFQTKHRDRIGQMCSEVADFKGFLVNKENELASVETGFPIHPIALFALDKLSKKVAQNERTFFTFLASSEPFSLGSFLEKNNTDEFHFIGINDIYEYFVPSIKAVQSDDNYVWYKDLKAALSKARLSENDLGVKASILKVIATIGVIGDSSALVSDKQTIMSVIDAPQNEIEEALSQLTNEKIIKYSGAYNRFEFYQGSVFDIEQILLEHSRNISNEVVINTLNNEFVNFVLYPNSYNRKNKISRVFIPVFAFASDLPKKIFVHNFLKNYEGILVIVLEGNEENKDCVQVASAQIPRSIVLYCAFADALVSNTKKYIALKALEHDKSEYIEKDPTFEDELAYFKRELTYLIVNGIEKIRNLKDHHTYVFSDGNTVEGVATPAQLNELASQIEEKAYAKTFIVNNELINKNQLQSGYLSARRNVLRAMIADKNPETYYDLLYLSPEYIFVRALLVKNGFISIPDEVITENKCGNEYEPQQDVKRVFEKFLKKAVSETVGFESLINTLTNPPYGLKKGYLPVLIAFILLQKRKDIIISSHGAEQELSEELFEEIVRRPSDFTVSIVSWDASQEEYLDYIEQLFKDNINTVALSTNRLKAIYEGMLAHYKSVSKYARTTEDVSEECLQYRSIMGKTISNYSKFFFDQLPALSSSLPSVVRILTNVKVELENAPNALVNRTANNICKEFDVDQKMPIGKFLAEKYQTEWERKRQKSFDYYTNAFLGYVATVSENDSDITVIQSISKLLTGFEIDYWNDSHEREFLEQISSIREKLESYDDAKELLGSEIKVTICGSNGTEKVAVFDKAELGDLGKTVKNKINTTMNNYGLSVSYDEKMQIILEVLQEMLEGK